MKLSVRCPAAAIRKIAEQCREFGVSIVFDTDLKGRGTSHAGRFEFEHREEMLHVTILEDLGHFSQRMLIGGLRQLAEEAAEAL